MDLVDDDVGDGAEGSVAAHQGAQEDADVVLEEGFDAPVPVPPLGLEARERMDQALSQAFINGKQEHFAELTRLIFEENYTMDYKVNPSHSITFPTMCLFVFKKNCAIATVVAVYKKK